jgi:prepilin-type N-terminal cleavage/methylation domain-containing protein
MNKIKQQAGFTLVELLVVIAIIGILASIVLPNVTQAIYKGQVAKAVSEVKNIETACTQVLSDTGRSNFHDFLVTDSSGYGKQKVDALQADLDAAILAADGGSGGTELDDIVTAVEALEEFYSQMFYNILRQGKNSAWAANHLDPTLRQKLANSYMDLGEDSWGQPYKFWAGPMRRGPMIFRSFRANHEAGTPDFDDAAFAEDDVYRYNNDSYNYENGQLPGAPRDEYNGGNLAPDYNISDGADDIEWYGFPAPKSLPVYVYSKGGNQLDDANIFIQLDPDFNAYDYPLYGGGDDINNWDTQQGWTLAPRS